MTQLLKINQNLLSVGLSNVAGVYALELANVAERIYHIDVEDLLAMSGLNKPQVESEHSQIPCFHLFALVLNVIRLTKDESVGLHLGKNLELRAFHMLGYVLMNCKNIREGIERVIRYERLVLELSFTSFNEGEKTSTVSWNCPWNDGEVRYFRELIITGWICISHKVLENPGEKLISAHFSHPEPKTGIEQYEKAYGCPVYFGEDFTGVTIDNSALKVAYLNYDPVLGTIMEQHANIMLQALNDNVAFLSEARAAIYRLMPSGDISLERLADEMKLSNKTLYNRFKRSGTSFSDVLDDVRRILSLIYLENPNINVLDVALLVGFTDQSSFSRAFKRWQKISPGDYRKKALKSGNLYMKKMDTLLIPGLNQPKPTPPNTEH